MSRVRFQTYHMASDSCKQLSEAMKIKRLRVNNSLYKYREGDRIINWGCATTKYNIPEDAYINKPSVVNQLSNKRSFFEFCKEKGICVPEFTTDKSTVEEWLEDGKSAFARVDLRGSGGKGIVDIQNKEQLEEVEAPLYTKYIPKKDEFRVHVVGGKVIFFQRKGLPKKIAESKNFNSRIRNTENGYIFIKNEDRPLPDAVQAECEKFISECDLDFYAIDIIYNAYRDKAYLLEINTAPGMDGTSAEDYSKALGGLL